MLTFLSFPKIYCTVSVFLHQLQFKKSQGFSCSSLFNFQGAYAVLATALLSYHTLPLLSTPFFTLFSTVPCVSRCISPYIEFTQAKDTIYVDFAQRKFFVFSYGQLDKRRAWRPSLTFYIYSFYISYCIFDLIVILFIL